MWSRSSPTRQFPFRAVSTSTRCPLACRSPAVFAATASSWTRPRRWNRPLPTSQGSDARAPTLASSPGLRSTSNRLRPTRPYRPRPLNADFRWSSSPASSELDLGSDLPGCDAWAMARRASRAAYAIDVSACFPTHIVGLIFAVADAQSRRSEHLAPPRHRRRLRRSHRPRRLVGQRAAAAEECTAEVAEHGVTFLKDLRCPPE